MIFKPTINKTILNIYNILWNIFCGFASFVLFFCIFATVLYNKYEEFLISKYITDAFSPYINNIRTIKELKIGFAVLPLFTKNTIQELQKEVEAQDKIINKNNKYYDNILVLIIVGIIVFFLLILIVPLLIGFISYKDVNLIYIGLNFMLNLILIVSFTILLLLYLIPLLNPIRLYNFFTYAFK